MTEEEKAEMEKMDKDLKGANKTTVDATPVPTPTPTPGIVHPEQTTSEPPKDHPASPTHATSPLTQDGPSAEHAGETTEKVKTEKDSEHSKSVPEPNAHDHTEGTPAPQTHVSTPGTSSPGGSTLPKDPSKRRAKLTPEQKQKLEAISDEREKAMEKRVEDLTVKLKERLRPFVHAQNPGEKDDPETKAWEEKMRREAEDLKLESFGVEVRGTALLDKNHDLPGI